MNNDEMNELALKILSIVYPRANDSGESLRDDAKKLAEAFNKILSKIGEIVTGNPGGGGGYKSQVALAIVEMVTLNTTFQQGNLEERTNIIMDAFEEASKTLVDMKGDVSLSDQDVAGNTGNDPNGEHPIV